MLKVTELDGSPQKRNKCIHIRKEAWGTNALTREMGDGGDDDANDDIKTNNCSYVNFVTQAVDLAVDESSFTGETKPSYKTTQIATKDQNGKRTTRKNIAYMGTLVRNGHGKVRTVNNILPLLLNYPLSPLDKSDFFGTNFDTFKAFPELVTCFKQRTLNY